MTVTLRIALIFVMLIVVPCMASEDTSTVNPNIQKLIDGFQGLWSDLKTRIISKYKELTNFQAQTKEEVSQKMNDTLEYLAAIKKHEVDLAEEAKNASVTGYTDATKKLDEWIADVKQKQTEWANAADDKKEELKNNWNKKMSDDWNSGMDKVILVSQNAKISDPNNKSAGNSLTVNFSVAVAMIFCIIYGLQN